MRIMIKHWILTVLFGMTVIDITTTGQKVIRAYTDDVEW